ncbi:hypothetical protein V6N13_133463 [Hibiscus sabdariffa]|uniref:Uncharacterized protein n=1 Tax=Hibiscus sabdariffa TaxID=183260 RepID=A0ABR2CIY7_9ROSI
MSATQSQHVLRLVLSCRSLKAHVTQPGTSYIVAMASSTEQEFLIQYRSKLDQFPRSRRFWDAKVASRVGEKLGFRLKEIGIQNIAIDVDEEISRPMDRRRLVLPVFDSLRRVGVEIDGAERLSEFGPNQAVTLSVLGKTVSSSSYAVYACCCCCSTIIGTAFMSLFAPPCKDHDTTPTPKSSLTEPRECHGSHGFYIGHVFKLVGMQVFTRPLSFIDIIVRPNMSKWTIQVGVNRHSLRQPPLKHPFLFPCQSSEEEVKPYLPAFAPSRQWPQTPISDGFLSSMLV